MRFEFSGHALGQQRVSFERTPYKRTLSLAILCLAALAADPARATTPGTPGTPQPATPIFIENFSNADPATWVRLTSYLPDIPGTGSTPNLPPKPAGESYTADAPWLTACNGMVLSFNSGGATPGECGAGGWAFVRQLAQALGQVDGMTQLQARQNLAVAAFTQANPGANLTQFRTQVDIPFLAPSTRFVTFSVDAAAVSCSSAHPAFQFAIFSGMGAPIPVGSTLNPCASGTPTVPVEAIGGNGAANVNAARFTTNQSYAFTGTSLGVLMRNAQGSGAGNDAAFDNIRVYDATPQLDKSFTPTVIEVGDTATLTLTVTNTAELAAKSGFSFTDSLPTGLTIAAAPAPTNSCGGSLSAVSGATSVTLTGGALAAGAASCTVTVPVTAGALGTYANGPANITSSTGLNPPGNAALVVMSTLGSGCPKVPIYTNTGLDPLLLQLWDPTSGAELGSVPLSESYGDIAITANGGVIYGVPFSGSLPEARRLDRIDPVTGAVIGSVVISGDMNTDDVVAINGLSVRSDGMLLVGSYESSNIYIVDPATGASTRLAVGFPVDVVSAGDFVTLPDGDILALGAQTDGSVAVYRIPPDLSIFQVGTVGTTFGAAMSGGDLYLIGAAGELFRVESIPTTASTDPLPATRVVDTGQPFYGATSVQDAGDSVCDPAVLTLQKVWIGAQVGDAVTMEARIDGDLIDSMDSVVATPAQTTTDATPITVYGGDVITFSEPFTSGSAANYTRVLTCTGNTNPVVGATLEIHDDDEDVVCTFTNTGAGVDLAISKTDGQGTYTPGTSVVYTIVVVNDGPFNAIGARVADPLPAGIVSASWTCTASGGGTCSASGSGAIDDTIDLPVGASATYTLTLVVPSGFVGNLVNTATALPPPGLTDPDPSNDSATDTDTPAPVANLSITKTDGATSTTPGAPITYTIVASNAGPSDALGATVSDSLPAAVTGATWTCTGAGGGSCPASGTGSIAATVNLPAGASVTFTVTGTVAEDAAGTLTNTATVAPPPGVTDPNPADNSATDVTTIAPVADLAVLKSGPASVSAGAAIAYTILVTNAGPSAADGATFSDPVPAGITGVTASCGAASGGAVCGPVNVAGNTVTSTITTLPSGGSVTITINGTAPDDETTLTNVATIAPPAATTDPNPADNTSTAVTTVDPLADVSVLKTGPATATAGATISYTLLIRNDGPSAADGSTYSDTVPAAITGVSASCDAATGGAVCSAPVVAGNAVSGTVPTLPSGATVTITVSGTAPFGAQTLTNTATVSGPPGVPDPNPANNSSSTDTTIGAAADIQVTKTVDDATPNVGDQVTFTIVATNLGPDDATGVAITDSLPFGMSLVSAAPSVGTFDPASGLWTIGNLPNGTSQTLTLTVSIDVDGMLTNHAVVSASDQPDPNTSNNSAAAAVNAAPTADIGVLKTVDDATPNVGSQVTYTLTATNYGPSGATGVEITDNLPAGVSFVGATASQGSYDSGSGVWIVGALANGASATLTITVQVDQAGPISNTATVTAQDQFDPNPTNNSSGTTINGQSADLGVTKTVDDSAPDVGENVTFTITIHNNGPSDATGVELTDQLPASLSFVSATPSQGSYDPISGVWSVGALTAAGPTSTATLTITATVVSAGATTNTATVTASDQPDPNPGNDSDSASLNGNPLADLAVTKSGPAMVTPGDDILYTIVVTNQGPSAATNVVIADATPAGLVFVGNAGACTTAYPCSLGTLPVGASRTITSTYSVPADYSGPDPIVNTAIASSDTPDPNPGNNQGSAQTGVGPGNADLAITKDGPASVASGGAISYTLLIVNNGPSPANGASYSDVVPAGITAISASCAGEQGGAACVTQPTVSGNTVSGTIGTLPSSGSVVVTINGTAPQGPLTLSNTATVTPPSGVNDPNPGNNQDEAGTVIGAPTADLAVVKTGPATVGTGGAISYTVIVSNAGPDAANGAVFSDPVPAGITAVTASCGGPTGGAVCGPVNVSGNLVTSTITTLPAGGSVSFTIGGTAPATVTSLSNTAGVQPPPGTLDPDPSDNEDTVETDVVEIATEADLAVVKTGPANVAAGSDAVYTIVVTNNGPDPAVNVVVADPTPAGLTFVSNAGACTTAYPCAIGTLSSGASATITTTFAVPADYAGPNPIVNTASASSDTPDPNPSDNSSTVTTPLTGTPMADLVVTKTGPASASPGQTISYTILVVNRGPDAVSDAVLVDPTPAGLSFVSSTAPCAGGFPCALPPLPNGASLTLTVTYTVQAGYTGTIVNVATAQSPTVPDPLPDNNTGTVPTPVGDPPEVIPVPVDARWMLLLMGALLMLAGIPQMRRRR